jgi:sec-independent protein translocase protein TatA
MPNIGPMELAIVAVIALLILGPKRLPSAGRSLGRGIREFRDGIGGRATAELDAAADQPTVTRTDERVAAEVR